MLSSRPRTGDSRVERLFLAVVAPAAHLAESTVDSITGAGDSMRLAGSLRTENERLRRQVEDMRRELTRLHGIEEELERLSRLSKYARAASGSNYVADVVYVDRESWLRTLLIHTGGERAGLNQVVVNDRGLVGRIITVAGGYAKVLLITDRSAAVSAMVGRTRRQGLVRGAGAGVVELDHMPMRSDVRVGDRVVTAGLDGVFPRGLPIGVVRSVEPGEGLFLRIEVTPSVDFGLLDQVNVLLQGPLDADVRRDLLEGSGTGGSR